MLNILVGLFLVLHGLVHLLFLGQSARYFELQPGLVWPDGSWVLSGLLGPTATRTLANLVMALSGLGFVVAGVGVLWRQDWWRPLVLAAALFSTASYVLLWDGTRQKLDQQGGIGILINLAILVAVLIFHWPSL